MSEDINKKIFSNNLKYYMNATGINQNDIIRDLNVPSATISSWVNGKRLPRMKKIQELANYMKITKSDLIESDINELFESNMYKFLNKNVQIVDTDIDANHPFNILQEKINQGETLTEDEAVYLQKYIKVSMNRFSKSLKNFEETYKKYYSLLNEEGQKKANEQMNHAVEQVKMLTKIPEYQRESLENYAEFVSDKTPEYWDGLRETLQQNDAGNALTSDPEIQEENQNNI